MSREQHDCTKQQQSNPSNPPAAAESESGGRSEPHPPAHESDLFPQGSGPRYFGTGRYGTGGSNAEGNDGIGELNPRGGYGRFTDAGGPGTSTLYGEEPPVDVGDEPDPAIKGSEKTVG